MQKSLINFLENSPTFYFIRLDLDNRFTYVNQYYQNHFDQIFVNFIGSSFLNSIHESSSNDFMNSKAKCLENLGSIEKVELQDSEVGSLGYLNFIKWNFFAITIEEGEAVELAGFGVSTSSVRKAKEQQKVTQIKLQALLNSTVESFYYLDKNMNVVAFNSGAKYKSMLYYKIDLQEGYYFPNLLVSGTEENFYKQFNNALNGIENYVEDRISFADGKSVWYRMSTKPVYDELNNITGVALSFLNIDDIKSAELRLKKIAWQQSHNVRKPLSNILGLVSLIKQNKNESQTKELIQMIDDSAKELDAIIKSIISKTI